MLGNIQCLHFRIHHVRDGRAQHSDGEGWADWEEMRNFNNTERITAKI